MTPPKDEPVRWFFAFRRRTGILANVSEESQRTYTAREIVLELFPATHEGLLPPTDDYRLENRGDGRVTLRHLPSEREAVMTPVSPAGNAGQQLCCDVCEKSAPRRFLQMYRVALPGSEGRRFRYLSLCRDADACALRRRSDEPLQHLLTRVFEG